LIEEAGHGESVSGTASIPSRRTAGTMLGLAERIVDPVKERGDCDALVALQLLRDG
jgi:hypothetical protein